MPETNEDQIQELLNKLNICACGHNEETWGVMLLLLERAIDTRAIGPNKEFLLPGISFYDKCEDASERWVEFGVKALDAWGLTDHGTSIRYAFLTDNGEILLDFLREKGTDPEKWEGIDATFNAVDGKHD